MNKSNAIKKTRFIKSLYKAIEDLDPIEDWVDERDLNNIWAQSLKSQGFNALTIRSVEDLKNIPYPYAIVSNEMCEADIIENDVELRDSYIYDEIDTYYDHLVIKANYEV